MDFPKYTKKPLSFYEKNNIRIPVFLETKNENVDSASKIGWLTKQVGIYRFAKWCLERFSNYFIDGFIERKISLWLKNYCKYGNMLEVGMGEGKFVKYIPKNCNYMGFDITPRYATKFLEELPENARVFLASADDIPLPNSSIDHLISTEVFEHITKIDKAIDEIYRVCKNGAKFYISIPNNFCYKYVKKGPHPEHVNNWKYQEFIKLLSPRFKVLEGQMKGFWIPIFKKSRYSLQLPLSHPNEYFDTNFFYLLVCVK